MIMSPLSGQQTRVRHFDHFDNGFDAQVIQEFLQIFLHLHRIVLQLRDCEDAERAGTPRAVLRQHVGQEDELREEREVRSGKEGSEAYQSAVVDDPPNVDISAQTVVVFGPLLEAFGDDERGVRRRHRTHQ